MVDASEAGKFFNPIVKKVWPNWVNNPMPMIQIIWFKLGVNHLTITIGNKVIKETSGNYSIIT